MNQDVIDAFEEYYSLKKQYDDQISKAKRKIIRDRSLDKTAKKQALASIRMKCINCGKPGGTIFSQENNILRARCNVVGDPCSLNIEINGGDYSELSTISAFVTSETNDLSIDIIRAKLDMLFGFIDETEALTTFNEKKTEFSELQSSLREIEEQFDEVIHNTRNREAISSKKEEIFVLVERLKDIIRQYKENNNPTLIDDSVSLYTNELYPAVTQLRELMYKKNMIECSNGEEGPTVCEDGIFYLTQAPYDYSEAQYVIAPAAVISNIK